MTRVNDRIHELGLTLPTPQPRGSYLPAKQVGDLLFVSGCGPIHPDGSMVTGVVGADVSVEDAVEAARLTAINLLGAIRTAVGDLARVRQFASLTGYVRGVPGFTDHPRVINGCSDLLLDVFGDAGRHSRAAIGVGSLPMDLVLEVTAILQVDPA